MSMWKDFGFSKDLGHVLFRTSIFTHQGDWWAHKCWRTVIPNCCVQVKCCRSLLYAGCVWNNWHCSFIYLQWPKYGPSVCLLFLLFFMSDTEPSVSCTFLNGQGYWWARKIAYDTLFACCRLSWKSCRMRSHKLRRGQASHLQPNLLLLHHKLNTRKKTFLKLSGGTLLSSQKEGKFNTY